MGRKKKSHAFKSSAKKRNPEPKFKTDEERRYARYHQKNSFAGFCVFCENPVYTKVSGWERISDRPVHLKHFASRGLRLHETETSKAVAHSSSHSLLCQRDGEETNKVLVCQKCQKRVCPSCFDELSKLCLDCIKNK